MATTNKRCRKGKNNDISSHPAPTLNNIAPELFIAICKYLEAKDLLSLARVCRLFHQYLSTDESTSTELIWRQSRETFMPMLKLGPPEGMSERNYARFLIEKGCQKCGKRLRGGARHNFCFMVRVCDNCFKENSTSPIQLATYIPIQLIQCLAKSTANRHEYWIPQAKKLAAEYAKFGDKDVERRDAWVVETRRKSLQIANDAADRRRGYFEKTRGDRNQARKDQDKRQGQLNEFINTMFEETNSDGSPKWDRNFLNQSQAYTRALGNRSVKEFTPRCWKILRSKLEAEYEKHVHNLYNYMGENFAPEPDDVVMDGNCFGDETEHVFNNYTPADEYFFPEFFEYLNFDEWMINENICPTF